VDAVEPCHGRPDEEENPELRRRKERVRGEDARAESERRLRDLHETPPVEGVRERAAEERGDEQLAELSQARRPTTTDEPESLYAW
jgi:hypothetical protein